jgi:hypothetical protein
MYKLKKYFFVFAIMLLGTANAQIINPNNRIKAALHFIKHNEMNTSMKMQSSLFNFTTDLKVVTSSSYDVSATTMQGIAAEAKILKIKAYSSNSMGKDTHYNSENPQAGDNKEAEQFSGLVGNVTKYKLDENAIVMDITRTSKSSAIQKINEYSSMEQGKIFDIFLNVKKYQNIGDSWADSITNPTTGRVVEKYTYKSFDKGIATVEVNSTMTMNQKMEEAEDEAAKEISLTFVTVATLQVDIATLLVKKRTSTTTSLNIMGAKEKAITTSTVITSEESIE